MTKNTNLTGPVPRLRSFRRILSAVAVLGIVTTSVASFAQGARSASVAIHNTQTGPHVNRDIFAQFAEQLGTGIYGGLWVGEDSPIPNDHGFRKDVIAALRELDVPLVRWPGGCYADQYHWREAVGPADKRVTHFRRNRIDDNAVGTQEFMRFLDLIGARAYISADVGDATPAETADWMEYMTAPAGSTLSNQRGADGHPAPWQIPYIGIGNELWGCGGHMRAEYAADIVRQYSQFIRGSGGKPPLKIAAGADRWDYHWTETLMKEAGSSIDGLGLHYYTYLHPDPKHDVGTGFGEKGASVGFSKSDWADTLAFTFGMDDLITRHAAIMDKYDPGKRVFLAVDEWGSWYKPDNVHPAGGLYQENTIRDALIAAINLNIFVKHADRVRLTAIAQMVNVLQAMVLTDGAKMLRTPTYWVYDMYKPWQDATSLPIEVNAPIYNSDGAPMPAISASAVRDTAGREHVALSNQDPDHSIEVSLTLDAGRSKTITGLVLTAPNLDSRNTFDHPDDVRPATFNSFQISGSRIVVQLPAKSVVVLHL